MTEGSLLDEPIVTVAADELTDEVSEAVHLAQSVSQEAQDESFSGRTCLLLDQSMARRN